MLEQVLALGPRDHSGYSPTSAAANGQHAEAKALTVPVVEPFSLLDVCLTLMLQAECVACLSQA